MALWLLQPVLLSLVRHLGARDGDDRQNLQQVIGDLARALDRLAVVLQHHQDQQQREGDEIRRVQAEHTEILHRLDYRTREIRDALALGSQKGAQQ